MDTEYTLEDVTQDFLDYLMDEFYKNLDYEDLKDGLFALATVHRYGDIEELEETFRNYKERNKSTYRSDLNI